MTYHSNGQSRVNWTAVDRAIEARMPSAIELLKRLIAERSTLGEEAGAQRVVAAELERLGFAVRELNVPERIEDHRGAGVAPLSYQGRPLILGERPGDGRSLLVNGHVDVVPSGDAGQWSSDPFEARVVEGWLQGRGAGDMKGGIAMAMLAIESLLECCPEALTGALSFLSVFEEECTGNGTLAAVADGVIADSVLLPEPTNLGLLLSGVGILWFEVTVQGRSAHAYAPEHGTNAIGVALCLLDALDDLARALNPEGGNRHAINVGRFEAGDWQSTVPSAATIGVRVGFPRDWSVGDAQECVLAVLDQAAKRHAWLAQHPPTVRFNGFRAAGYTLDPGHELAQLLRAAHTRIVGQPPCVDGGGGTTDARHYINEVDVPAICYGPRARNIHGVDEAVELASIRTGARVLTRFFVAFFASHIQTAN
jgi:acetylornithine deacetylase